MFSECRFPAVPGAGALALALGVLAAPQAAAQDDADEAVDLGTMQVTAGRVEEPQFGIPQPVTVLSREQIERASPQVMSEALRGGTGAFFQQTGPGQGIVIVRGLKGAEVLHLVDGMRLNNAFFRTAPSQYIALLDPFLMEQVELVRGPYATLYGSDAMGGIVHVVTPEPRFDGEALSLQGRVRAHYASADLARTLRVEAAGGRQGLAMSGGYSILEHGKRRLSEPGQSPDGQGGFTLAERVNDTAYLARGWDWKATLETAGAGDWMASVQFFELPSLPRYNETVPGFGVAPDAATSEYRNQRAFYHLRWRSGRPLAFADAIEAHLGHQLMVDNRFERSADLSRDAWEFNRSGLTGLTLQAQSTPGAHHRLVYGLEAYLDEVQSRSLRQSPPGSGAVQANAPGGFQSRFPDGARAEHYGLYLLEEWTPAPRWLVDAGARYSLIRTSLPRADRALGAELSQRDLSGSTGLRFALTESLGWTLNAGTGFRAPNVNDLAQVGRRSGGRTVVANLALEPETMSAVDSGLKFAAPGWQAELGAFYMRYRDRITLVDDVVAEGTGGCPDDGDADAEPCAQNRNVARATYWGVESGWRWVPAPAVVIRGALNFTYGTQTNAGVRSPANRVPPLNGQIGVEYRGNGWSVEPYAWFADGQDRLDARDLRDARIRPDGTPGYVVVHLRLSWQPWLGTDLQLEGRNLLDRAYREHGSGIDGPARGIAVTMSQRF